jgi:hypothetical protein
VDKGDHLGDDSPSEGVHRQDQRLAARYRAWKQALVAFGVITSILLIVLVAVVIGAITAPAGPIIIEPGGTHQVRVAVSPTGQILAVAGLIIACISALGTLLSGLGTLITARAIARQGVPTPEPKTSTKPRRPRTRKVP